MIMLMKVMMMTMTMTMVMVMIMMTLMMKRMRSVRRNTTKMIKMIVRSMMMIVIIFRSVNDIDLYTGGLAETPVSGAVIGPTFLVNSRFVWFKKTKA